MTGVIAVIYSFYLIIYSYIKSHKSYQHFIVYLVVNAAIYTEKGLTWLHIRNLEKANYMLVMETKTTYWRRPIPIPSQKTVVKNDMLVTRVLLMLNIHIKFHQIHHIQSIAAVMRTYSYNADIDIELINSKIKSLQTESWCPWMATLIIFHIRWIWQWRHPYFPSGLSTRYIHYKEVPRETRDLFIIFPYVSK